MKKIVLLVGMFIVGFFGMTSLVANTEPKERYVSIVRESLPKTVTVYVTLSHEDENKVKRTGDSKGAGVFITPNGHILTCNHLFESKYKREGVRIETYGGTVFPATLVYQDPARDLALLRIDMQGNPYALLDTPGDATPGQEVIAIGSPLGLTSTVTTGVISAVNRDIIRYDMVQMSAPINPGNSGGPLFNLSGRVVGINTNIWVANVFAPTWSGLGFAVSSSEINRFLTTLKGLEKAVK